jgi:hypothetical protein
VEQQKPKWISEARKMISDSENRVRHYWENLPEEERRDLCFLSHLKKRHVKCVWDDLTEAEKIALWHGVLKVRKMQHQTRLLTPEEFKGVVSYSLGTRASELAERAEQLAERAELFADQVKAKTFNSMH